MNEINWSINKKLETNRIIIDSINPLQFVLT